MAAWVSCRDLGFCSEAEKLGGTAQYSAHPVFSKLKDRALAGPRSMLLGGSWVVIRGVRSPLIWVIMRVTLLITPLTTPPEPPST